MVKVLRNVSGIKDCLSNHELGKVYWLKPKDKILGGNAGNWRLKAFRLRYNFQRVKIQYSPGRKALNFPSRQSSSRFQALEALLPVSSTRKEERQNRKIILDKVQVQDLILKQAFIFIMWKSKWWHVNKYNDNVHNGKQT